MHHYITKYQDETGRKKAASWFQINVLGKCFCLFKREITI